MAIFGLQLLSTDVEKVVPFYETLFQWKLTPHPMGFYHATFEDKGPRETGCTLMPHPMVGMPSTWLSYIEVEDMVQVMSKTPLLGGQIVQIPLPSPLGGVFAVISDPAGAILGVFQRVI